MAEQGEELICAFGAFRVVLVVEDEPSHGIVFPNRLHDGFQEGFLWKARSIEEALHQAEPPEGGADGGKIRFIKGDDGPGSGFIGGDQAVQAEGEGIPAALADESLFQFLFDFQVGDAGICHRLRHIGVAKAVQDEVAEKAQEIGIFLAFPAFFMHNGNAVLEEGTGGQIVKAVSVTDDVVALVGFVEKEKVRSLQTDPKRLRIGLDNGL